MSRRERLVYRLLMLMGAASLIAFYGWWFQPQHLPTNLQGAWHGVDLMIYATLTFVLSHRIFMDVYMWVVARKIAPIAPAPEPEEGLKVAFITTFVPGAEGIDLLRRTLPAMLAADYPHDVWLLDEGADPDARALAESLGVHYFTRHGRREYNLVAGPFTARTKGGNHNSWYDAHGHVYDVVAQIDTDFIPHHTFLTATLGYFQNPRTGWVVTPQIYGNTASSFVTRGAAEQQYTFYGAVLRGLSGRRLANMLGANHVVRVAALDSIGLYAGHLTEDLLTGMRLHSRGWESAYVPLALAVGEGPDTWKSYFTQQTRWSYGCMHILKTHTRALLKTMRWPHKLLYLSLLQGYFSGLAGALGTALLTLYFLAGVEISKLTIVGLLIWATPLFVARQLIQLWLQRFTVRPDVERGLRSAGGLIGIAVWPIYFVALVKVLRQQSLGFKVTPKGSASRRPVGVRQQFRPHLVVAALSAVCLGSAAVTGRDSAVLVFWVCLNLVTMGGFWLLAGRLPRVARRRTAPARTDDGQARPVVELAAYGAAAS
ncbi:glycosyltransferase family 2 protein [Aeromicrobium wangtongii]|uniref:glycosyltransferase family 2 protein n=1 Tax=Aeromicrobium wangtongii TaxID=2969247 RepID=UPI0020173B28|nr:glycosyltransferase family 2 protein [Aeromicrobium wangtongii]MCL3817439.1 glycosyltransferase [Aeromicrobium wangtongii]